MWKNRTMRQLFAFFAVVSLIVPLVLVSVAGQLRMWKRMRDTLNETIRQELDAADRIFEMELGQYGVILYNFCVDEEVVALARRVLEKNDLQGAGSSLRRRMAHESGLKDGVEGLTLKLRDGSMFVYGFEEDSGAVSSSAGQGKIPQELDGETYQTLRIRDADGREQYLIQICRKLFDYRNAGEELGTAVMSIRQDALWQDLPENPDAAFYLCGDGVVVASGRGDCLGESISQVDGRGCEIRSLVNRRTSWILWNYHQAAGYRSEIYFSAFIWLFAVLACIALFLNFLWWITTPVILSADDLLKGMTQVEQGDFTVCLPVREGAAVEQKRIAEGFNEMVERLEGLLRQVKESMMEQRSAELSALEAQIDPHFLYNTLDAINWKAIENGQDEISEMLAALADILRYSIRSPGSKATVREAIYWLRQYVKLQSAKLEHGLTFEIQASPEVLEIRIHKLLLQPFVENAVRHAYVHMEGTCRLKVSFLLENGSLHAVVMDNGAGMPPELVKQLNSSRSDGEHLGIMNIKKRLELYYGEKAGVFFESEEGRGTTAHLFIHEILGESGDGI